MNYLFLLPQSMLDKLESCGKLSLPHCTLAKITEEKKNNELILQVQKQKFLRKGCHPPSSQTPPHLPHPKILSMLLYGHHITKQVPKSGEIQFLHSWKIENAWWCMEGDLTVIVSRCGVCAMTYEVHVAHPIPFKAKFEHCQNSSKFCMLVCLGVLSSVLSFFFFSRFYFVF